MGMNSAMRGDRSVAPSHEEGGCRKLVFSGGSRLSSATAGMAMVAIDAVVHVPVHVRMLEVARVVVSMAARALPYRVVTSVDVARRAVATCIAMGDWELGVVSVWERRTGPIAGAHAVAGPARCNREERGVYAGGMGRVCGSVVVSLMACAARVAV